MCCCLIAAAFQKRAEQVVVDHIQVVRYIQVAVHHARAVEVHRIQAVEVSRIQTVGVRHILVAVSHKLGEGHHSPAVELHMVVFLNG